MPTHQPILVARDIDRNDLLKTKVPFELGNDKRSYKAA